VEDYIFYNLEEAIQKIEEISNHETINSIFDKKISRSSSTFFHIIIDQEDLRELFSIIYKEIDKSCIWCDIMVKPSKQV
jgi:hypothetical protein